MAANGTYLVPTLVAGEGVERLSKSGVLKGNRAEKAMLAAAAMRNSLKIAVANGVPIAFGTDAGVVPHGTNGHEFVLMVEWGGMSPMSAIVARRSLGTGRFPGAARIGSPATWVQPCKVTAQGLECRSLVIDLALRAETQSAQRRHRGAPAVNRVKQ